MILASLTRPVLVQNAPDLVIKDDDAYRDPLPSELKSNRSVVSKARSDFQVHCVRCFYVGGTRTDRGAGRVATYVPHHSHCIVSKLVKVGLFAKKLHRRASAAAKLSTAEKEQVLD